MEENNGTFICPTFKLVQQLMAEVKQLRLKLDNIYPMLLPRLDNADLKMEFHISAGCAADWRNAGLSYTKVGKKIYYDRTDIESFLAKRKVRGF